MVAKLTITTPALLDEIKEGNRNFSGYQIHNIPLSPKQMAVQGTLATIPQMGIRSFYADERLEGCNFREASFYGLWEGVSFRKTNCEGASFMQATVSNCSFEGANIIQAQFPHSIQKPAKLRPFSLEDLLQVLIKLCVEERPSKAPLLLPHLLETIPLLSKYPGAVANLMKSFVATPQSKNIPLMPLGPSALPLVEPTIHAQSPSANPSYSVCPQVEEEVRKLREALINGGKKSSTPDTSPRQATSQPRKVLVEPSL